MVLRTTFAATCAAVLFAAPAAAQHDDLLLYMARGEIDIADADEGTRTGWDIEAWAGGDEDKLWLKSEGALIGGDTHEAEAQILFSHMISEFWNLQAGLRHDWEPSSLTHLVLGVEGLSPYFFETDAALFLSEDGDLTARLEQSIDLLITQQLILEPHAELHLAADDVPELGLGAGLTHVEAGLQLRYEITRKFAPYIDVVYERALGETAILSRAFGEDVEETTLRAGIRFWF